MTTLIVLNRHEDEGKPDGSQELLIRVEGSPTVWDIEVVSGDAAARELGWHENAGLGLNIFTDDDEVHQRGILIVARPELTQAEAQEAVLELLVRHELLPDAPVRPGKWEDFADHPEGEMVLSLIGKVESLRAMTPEEREEHTVAFDADDLLAQLGVTREEMEASRLEEEREDAEAIARGRLRVVQEAKPLASEES